MCERLLRYCFLFLYVCYGFSLIILSLMLCAEDKNVRKDRHLNYPIYDHTKTAAQVSFQFTLSFLLLFSFLFFFDGLVLVRLCFWFTYIIYLWRSADCSVYFNPNCVWLNSSCCLHFNKISVQIWLASIFSKHEIFFAIEIWAEGPWYSWVSHQRCKKYYTKILRSSLWRKNKDQADSSHWIQVCLLE